MPLGFGRAQRSTVCPVACHGPRRNATDRDQPPLSADGMLKRNFFPHRTNSWLRRSKSEKLNRRVATIGAAMVFGDRKHLCRAYCEKR
jgi:hypothetical protein